MKEIKTATKYECEICREKFDSAEECEIHEVKCKNMTSLRRSVQERMIIEEIDTNLIRYYFNAQSEEEAKIFIKQTGAYQTWKSDLKDLKYPQTLIIEQYYSYNDYEHAFYTANYFVNMINRNIRWSMGLSDTMEE